MKAIVRANLVFIVLLAISIACQGCSKNRRARNKNRVEMSVKAIEAPDIDWKRIRTYRTFYVDRETQIEGKYILRHLKGELYLKGLEVNKSDPDIIILAVASEAPIAFEIPPRSFLLPILKQGTETEIYDRFDKIGSLKTKSKLENQEFIIPGKKVISNSRNLKVWIYRSLKKSNDEPEMIWRGSVYSEGDLALTQVYRPMVEELMSSFPHGDGTAKKRVRQYVPESLTGGQ